MLLFSENIWQIEGAQGQDVCALNSNQTDKKTNKKPLLLLEKEMYWDDLVVEFR